jgi:putative ABC transport system permease protein
MTVSGFIIKNAFRNKRRATLCTLSVAMSMFLLVTLLVALRELTQPAEDVGSSLRIAVRHKVSLASPLPVRQRVIIAKLPGVAAVTPLTFFGGRFRNEEATLFAQFAMDPEILAQVFGEAKMPRDQLEAWIADRTSCIVGVDTATRYKLKIGDRLTFIGQYFPVDVEVKIAGFYKGTTDDRNVFFHQKYLDELMGNPGTVGMWWVRAASPEVVPAVIDRINAAFANSSAEVLAETERAFQLSFISMWANIKILIGSVCSVVVFALSLVTASTMSMAVRERLRELAVLKALGFRRHELLVFILAESFGLAMLGCLLGAGGAWALYTFGNVPQLTGGFFPYLEVTPRILGRAALVAALLGVVSSLSPWLAVARQSVVEGLRTLD